MHDDKDLLLRVVTKLAAKTLEEDSFIPFAAAVDFERHVEVLVPKSMKSEVTQSELENYFVEELRSAVSTGKCTAACFCADVRVPTAHGVAPALVVHIEGPTGWAETVVYRYRQDEHCRIMLDAPTTVPTIPRIFGRTN